MGQQEAAYRLQELLTDPGRPHRVRWEAHGRPQRGRTLNLTSVLKVLADHLVEIGELDELDAPSWPRRRKDWIRRALGVGPESARLTATELGWFRGAFGLSPSHHLLLTDLLRSTGELGLLATQPSHLREVRRAYVTERVLESHRVGPDRRPLVHTSTHTIRSLADGLDAYWYVFDTEQAAVRVRTGGRLRETVQVSEHFWAAAIRLDVPLGRGETALLVYDTYFDYRDDPPPEFRRGSSGDPDAQIDVEVVFDPAALPTAVWQGHWPTLDGPTAVEHRVEPDAGGCVRTSVTRLESGLVGLRWQWD